MRGGTVFIVLGLIGGVAAARADQGADLQAAGRVITGSVATSGQKPVKGARVLFGRPDQGVLFADGATATTDQHGRYRADLGKLTWSTGAVRHSS